MAEPEEVNIRMAEEEVAADELDGHEEVEQQRGVSAGFERQRRAAKSPKWGLNFNVNIGWLDAGTGVLPAVGPTEAAVGVEPMSMRDFTANCLARG
jgi:hypothetical protein